MSPEERLLETWKMTVEVQMHFNELEMKVRSFAITVLAAFLAAVGFVLKEDIGVTMFGRELSLSGMILMAAVLCWGAFYLMDRFWYHRLLRGAVNHGVTLETKAKTSFPELSLGTEIGLASPIILRQRKIGRFIFKERKIGSDRKIDIFYGIIAFVLLVAAAIAFWNEPPKSSADSINPVPQIENSPSPAERIEALPELKPSAEVESDSPPQKR